VIPDRSLRLVYAGSVRTGWSINIHPSPGSRASIYAALDERSPGSDDGRRNASSEICRPPRGQAGAWGEAGEARL